MYILKYWIIQCKTYNCNTVHTIKTKDVNKGGVSAILQFKLIKSSN